jgi:PPM family protein phosphatase
MANDSGPASAKISHEAETRPRIPISALVQVDLGAVSHPGRVRKENEDHFIGGRFDRTMRTLVSNLPEGHIPKEFTETCFAYLVADGVGGAVAGELASRTVVQALVDLVLDSPAWIMRFDGDCADKVLQRTADRFQKARELLVAKAAENPTLKGMATTLTFACSAGHDLLTAHVGDSRAYLRRRDGTLERLTRDQTMAQSLADAGAIAQKDVEHHPSRHILTSALATRGAFAQVELKHWRIEDGDCLLLCSDGLTEMISEDTLSKVLAEGDPAAKTCQRLVDLALEAGGKDNVTVIIAGYRIPA